MSTTFVPLAKRISNASKRFWTEVPLRWNGTSNLIELDNLPIPNKERQKMCAFRGTINDYHGDSLPYDRLCCWADGDLALQRKQNAKKL